jgi:hypothetical protein
MKLFALAVSTYLVLQSPAASPTAQQAAKSTIEGVVIRADSSEPIAGARVFILPGNGITAAAPSFASSSQRPALTDNDGKFVLKDLEAGQYRLAAARNGYARLEYGQRAVGRIGVVLNVLAGQSIRNVVISLQPAGLVTGRVTNDAGDPLAGIDVTLLRPTYNPGGARSFNAFAATRTNDLGEYRLYWITPGRYYLGASSSRISSGRLPNANELLDDVYGTTYYPNTLDPAAAVVIDVRPGGELSGIDFRMRLQQTYHVRGRVIDNRTGQPPRNANVFIVSRQFNGVFGPNSIGPSYNAATGTFDLADVVPGSYWVRAMTSDNVPGPYSRNVAQIAIDVSGSDVENLALTLVPGTSIAGHIQVEGSASLGGIENFDKLRIVLTPLVPGTPIFPSDLPVPKQDGSFTADSIAAGEYRIGVAGMPPDYYIKEARLGASDILQDGFSMPRLQSERFEILLSPNGGQIDGDVIDEHGNSVRGVQPVLIPDRDRDRRDLFRTTTTDQNGHFTMKGIPPGVYKIFAWEDVEPFAYFDPETLRRYEPQAKTVTVSDSSKLSVPVKVIPAGQ